MREIILDTETTGLDPAKGHRIIEIGCVELLNAVPTGETFHVYIDPERNIPKEAFRIHGLAAKFLKGKPVFAKVVDDLLNFFGDANIVAHNAEFDIRFLNAELSRLDLASLSHPKCYGKICSYWFFVCNWFLRYFTTLMSCPAKLRQL